MESLCVICFAPNSTKQVDSLRNNSVLSHFLLAQNIFVYDSSQFSTCDMWNNDEIPMQCTVKVKQYTPWLKGPE